MYVSLTQASLPVGSGPKNKARAGQNIVKKQIKISSSALAIKTPVVGSKAQTIKIVPAKPLRSRIRANDFTTKTKIILR